MYKKGSLLLYNTDYVGSDFQKTLTSNQLCLLTSHLHDLTLCLFMCCNQEKVYTQNFYLISNVLTIYLFGFCGRIKVLFTCTVTLEYHSPSCKKKSIRRLFKC